MTTGERSGSLTQAWSEDIPVLSVMRRRNRPGSGSGSVTVFGSSMGVIAYTVRSSVGETRCEATEWGASTSVRCMAFHGIRGMTRQVLSTAGKTFSCVEDWPQTQGVYEEGRRDASRPCGLPRSILLCEG